MLPNLPESIKSIDDLHSYALNYALEAHNQIVLGKFDGNVVALNLDNTPSLRLNKISSLCTIETTLSRMVQIFEKALQLDDPKVMCLPENLSYHFFIHLTPANDDESSRIAEKFKHYLLINNGDALPSFIEIIQNLYSYAQKNLNETESYLASIESLKPDEIAEWMKLPRFSGYEKDELENRVSAIVAHLKVYLRNMEFILKNPKTTQLLDVYLLAELSFDVLSVMENFSQHIIISGYFFPKEEHVVTTIAKQMSLSNRTVQLCFDEKELKPIPEIKNFFRHKQFPLRSLYLFSRGIAFSLRDFANTFRAQAGLSPIPNEIFEQRPEFIEAIEIDEGFLDVEAFVKMKHEQDHLDWTKGTLAHNFLHNKQKPLSRKARENNKATLAQSTHIKKHSPSLLSKKKASKKTEVAPIEIDIGSRVRDLLEEADRDALTRLFFLKENTLSKIDMNRLVLAVYKTLLDLNKGQFAAEFLSRSSNTKLFSTTGTNDMLSKSDMEKRIAAFLSLDLVHPDFKKKKLLEINKNLCALMLAYKLKSHGKEFNFTKFCRTGQVLKRR